MVRSFGLERLPMQMMDLSSAKRQKIHPPYVTFYEVCVVCICRNEELKALNEELMQLKLGQSSPPSGTNTSESEKESYRVDIGGVREEYKIKP